MTSPTTNGYADEVLSTAVQQVVQQSRILALHVTRHDEWLATAQEKIDQAIADGRETLEQVCQSALDEANTQAEARKTGLMAHFSSVVTNVQQEAASYLSQLQETHRQQVAKIEADGAALLNSMHSEITAALQQAAAERERMQIAHREEVETQRQTLNREHRDALNVSLETIRREREDQRNEYLQLRQRTVADMNLERERMQAAHQEAAHAQSSALSREHREALETGLDAVHREREEQRGEYQRLLQQTDAELNRELGQALETRQC